MVSRSGKTVALFVALVVALLSLVACSTPAPAATPTKPAAGPAAAGTPAATPTKPAAGPAATGTPAATAPAKAAEPAKPSAAAPSWPEKGRPITVICPLSAGSGSDIAARLMAAGLEKELGTPVQVANKPGGGTVIGMTEVAKAKPDGYTLGTAVFMSLLVSYLDPEMKATYGRKDFQPIAHFSRERNVLVVKGDSSFKTLKDLVDHAKANPGKVKFGGSGILGNPHIAMLMLAKAAGVEFAAVQFPGAGDAVTAVLGGHVDFTITGGSTVVGHVKDGAVRILGITDEQPNEFFPGSVTLRDQGYDVVAPFSIGLVGPAGMPKEAVTALSKALGRAYENPDFAGRVKSASISADYMDTDKFTAYWDQMEPRVKPYVQLVRQEQK